MAISANYESIVNNVYHYIWTQLNQLDVFLATDPNNAVLTAQWEAFWNVLAHLDPDAAADRAKSYKAREQFMPETEVQVPLGDFKTLEAMR